MTLASAQQSLPPIGESIAEGETGAKLKHAGQFVLRYGLAVVFLYVGALKFTAYEAKGIEGFVANSPLWSWAYQSMGFQGVSNLIGVIEISIGALIATRAFWPKLSAIGSIAAAITFLITLTFLFTTPGVWESGYGFPFPSAVPGQFLLKDLVLLGASIWTAAEALAASRASLKTSENEMVANLMRAGEFVMRYGLAAVFLWIGFLKFTAYEAANIEPFVTNSPIWSWAYQSFGLQGVSSLIGVIEIAVGALIATRALWPKASAIGSVGAVVTFLITLSFLLTTPGLWEPGYGFPFAATPGLFLMKDMVLLGASIWIAGEAWLAASRSRYSRG